MDNKYILQIKDLVLDMLKDQKTKVFIFGSRAYGDNTNTSDIDIGLLPYEEIEPKKITLLKEKLEDLNVPYKVEIVDFNEVSEEFKNEALKKIILWKE